MTRVAKGYLVGQVIVAGKLVTHLTVVSYFVRNKDLPCDHIYLRLRSIELEDNQPPEEWTRWPDHYRNAKEAIELFEQHCEPTDIGNAKPYWRTLYDDLVTECWAATSHLNWIKASEWITTPWDIIAYAQAWGYQAGVQNPSLTVQTNLILKRLWKHLQPDRQDQLNALQQWTYHRQHRKSRRG